MTAPVFVELNEVRSYNPGIDDEYEDKFYFYFNLELNDIDTSEPVTAKLQYADIGSEDWEDCPMLGESVLTAVFDGDDTYWSCEDLVFDIYTLEYKGAIGLMKQARILVEFTYLDGSEDSVLSTELYSLFIYRGDYIHTVSSSYEDGVISCTFRVDTALVLDLTKLELTQLTLTRYREGEYYNMQDIINDADISEFAEDGMFRVTYTPTEPLDPDDINDVIVAFDYSDHNDFIYWHSAGFASLDVPVTFTAPTLDSAVVLQDDGFSYVPITVTVADGTMYGDLTATLEYWNGSGYELFEDDSGDMTINTISLSRSDSTTSWVTEPSSGDCLIAELSDPDGYGFFRVSLQYVDDTGLTQYVYSEPFVVYQGTYVRPDEEESIEVGDGYFYATYRIDPDLVDPEKVDTVEFSATSISGADILNEIEWFEIHADTGEVSVRGQISYAGAGTDEYFIATVKLLYTNTEAGPVTVEWEAESSVEIVIEYGYSGGIPPEVVSSEVINLDSTFYVTFSLLMNDAEEVTARLYRAVGVDSYEFNECDASFGTAELYCSIVSDPLEYWNTSPEDACLSYDASLEYGVPGLFYWFYIEFECTMPDGSVEYVYSDDIPAYLGSFFVEATEYAVAAYNPVTQEFSSSWLINRNLAPDLSKVSVERVVIVPGSDSATEVELPSSCVSFNSYDPEYDYEAYVFAEGVTLAGSSEWTLELTLSYNGERFIWTSTQSMVVAELTKSIQNVKQYQNIPQWGKQEVYHEEKKQRQNLYRDRYSGDPGAAAGKSKMASHFGEPQKRSQRDGSDSFAPKGGYARHHRSPYYTVAGSGHRLADLSGAQADTYLHRQERRQGPECDEPDLRPAQIRRCHRGGRLGPQHTRHQHHGGTGRRRHSRPDIGLRRAESH